MDMLQLAGRHFIADPILEPIHFGFADSLVRYHQLREHYPSIEIMMGAGNLSELTDADTTGVNALLMGIISELHITNLLTTQVSSHCRKVVRELDLARRIMYAARADHSLPQKLHDGLLTLRDKKPFPYSSAEIEETARDVRDPSFRIQVNDEGISLYNRDGLCRAKDPYEFFAHLDVEEDGAHAFYLGVELARAQIAWQLGKRYVQDEELAWGCAVDAPSQDLDRYKPAGATLEHTRKKKVPRNDS
jgi:dihydropteroate synthase-like protein